MYLQFDHPTLEARVRESITKFCQKNMIKMPKNGDTVALAYQLAVHLRPYGMMYSDRVHITNDMYMSPMTIDDQRYTAEWNVYKDTEMVIDGHQVRASVHVATFGYRWHGHKHEPEEYSQLCWKAVMNGNENTPEWEDLYYDREKFYTERERQNIEAINSGR